MVISAEEVTFPRTDHICSAAIAGIISIATEDDDRKARGLFHNKSARGGNFVSDGENRRRKILAVVVGASPEIDQRGDSGDTDRDIC